MSKLVVVYDACVLYPAPLRDLLIHLAMTNLFQAKWTNQIHDEWMRNVLLNRPDLKLAQLERTKALMNAHIRGCLVTGYERLIPKLKLPDPDDRHVLAAAVRSESSFIITYNLKDFPQKSLAQYAIKAEHPDRFLEQLISIDQATVLHAIQKLRANLKNPPLNTTQYLAVLAKQSLPKTVKELERLSNLL